MIIKTKYLGYVEADENCLLKFPRGIYGFDDARRFALLKDLTNGNPFMWLQNADAPEPCFVVVEPQKLRIDYGPDITAQMAEKISLDSEEDLRILVIATVPKEYSRLSLNLKCPVLINSAKNLASQVILEDERYPMRYHIFQEAGK